MRRLLIALMTMFFAASPSFAQEKPNIVLVFMDNFGWGEPGFNGGGIIRGAPTPELDALAAEGLRLTNFNVEVQCTPSRSAIMTGRYAIRSGNGAVPLGEGVYGLVQWEVTMAEMLSEAGYATGMYGKWHLGRTKGRFPTDQGFDEWYGIPNTTDESVYSSLMAGSSSDFGRVSIRLTVPPCSCRFPTMIGTACSISFPVTAFSPPASQPKTRRDAVW